MDIYANCPAQSTLPAPAQLETSRSRLFSRLTLNRHGLNETKRHLEEVVAPALSLSSQSSTYYGFVTGGATAAANFADHMAVDYDQNVQVHLPEETIATDVEDCALRMLCELIGINPNEYKHRTFTTGATASNVLGLALGRQHAIERVSEAETGECGIINVAEHGLFASMRAADVDKVQVLTTVAHSSLRKAASIVGLGRDAVIEVGLKDVPHRFDFDLLLEHLHRPNTASIIVVSCAEVNTGFFATDRNDMDKLRNLCDGCDAWLHVDGAFGLLARVLPAAAQEYTHLRSGVAGLELADSITGDAHKLINVVGGLLSLVSFSDHLKPYDCGFFFSRSVSAASEVFQNPNAAYLSSASANTIPSPLNIGIENSRRFRALPVYATLVAYGHEGYSQMIHRQVQLARAIAAHILESPDYELLPASPTSDKRQVLERIYIVVLFRARNGDLNQQLVARINDTRKIYVSGTVWRGSPAARFAIANWQADVDRDLPVVTEVLDDVALRRYGKKLRMH